MAVASLIGQVDRAQVGAHCHGLRIHHQNRRRRALRQPCAPAQQQVFEAPLQGGVERGANQRWAIGRIQPPRQQWRQGRLLARCQQQGFFGGLLELLGWPHLVFAQTLQHLVAGALGTFGVAVRAQAAGCLGQHRKQCRFGRRQVFGRLAQIRPAGSRHALQGAAKGRAVEVDLQDFALRQVPLQLCRAP
ncbi:hypothetical protein D3C81_1514950 [compost metagenome]